MYVRKKKGPLFVTLEDGRQLSRADLPPPETRRWVASRKAKVVAAIENKLITVEEACETYDLSEEELSSWRKMAKEHGTAGLRTTALRKYRQP